MMATFPACLPIADWGMYVGLWLNRPRIQLWRATEYALGHHAATSPDPLGMEWFDAVAFDDSEVDRLESLGNLQRGR